MPVIEETITTEPPPEARRCGRPDRISSAAWPAFRAKVAVNSSSAALVRLPLPTVPPALATRWSRPPSAAAIWSTAWFSAGVSVTSAAAVATEAPRSASRPAAVARPSASLATSPTAAPSATSASAIAKPMPRLPPVISTRRPRRSRSIAMIISRRRPVRTIRALAGTEEARLPMPAPLAPPGLRPAAPPEILTALGAAAELGMFFRLPDPAREAAAWQPAGLLYADGQDHLDGLLASVRAALGGCEPRVAASLFFQGYAARLLSPQLACLAVDGCVPDMPAARLAWRHPDDQMIELGLSPGAGWAAARRVPLVLALLLDDPVDGLGDPAAARLDDRVPVGHQEEHERHRADRGEHRLVVRGLP